ncbi:MAG: Efflux ABC transporter, ATP-binding protein [uncultured Thermomicrobiales bacterium]|uniref:Efflux ABC transporter, ATP-binding protein n=1 Tax=uncultured Thermomicrobiales bacterium TaxID=1645740 RepID=A0A6J4UR52_9BACT|nr:MAG: Efflux ABC transporter, ATP-binding protein [uncultured Thermomicrobiales bacterium]
MSDSHPIDAAIVTSGLSKRYGEVEALSRLDLAVPRGAIYGFLGPNGAGKTTTIRLLMGFVKPSAGWATVLGHDAWRDGVAARRELGFLVAPDALYTDMTGLAQLDYAASLSGRPPLLRGALLDALELSEAALGRRLGTYSKGMRQKLALTAAIQHDPALLILDEPTDGLDPLIQRAFEQVLRERRDLGRTVFMSSHDLAEVERTCERVAVVRGGRLIAEETIVGLKRRQRRSAEVVFRGAVPEGLGRVPRVATVGHRGDRVELSIDGDVAPLLRFLAGEDVVDLLLPPPRLEDIFMGFYGDGTDGERDQDGPADDGQHLTERVSEGVELVGRR